jgi:hypothetical protein
MQSASNTNMNTTVSDSTKKSTSPLEGNLAMKFLLKSGDLL